MASLKSRTLAAETRTFPAKGRTMPPNEKTSFLRQRTADWLTGHYGRHAAKRLQDDFEIGGRSAEYALAGDISPPLFQRVLAEFGRPLAEFLFAPARHSDTAFLDIADDTVHDARASVSAIGHAVGLLAGGRVRSGGALHHPAGGRPGCEGRVRDSLCDGDQHDGAGLSLARHSVAGLGRFTTRIIECAAIPDEAATDQHRSLLNIIAQTSGEFTNGIADDMRATGLDRRSWLYRAEPAFPVLHVGADIPIVSADDHGRILGRPLREQPLAPTFLDTIMRQFDEVIRLGRPGLHRIAATFGAETIIYDRVTNHFPGSDLFMSCCLPVAA